MIAFEQSNSTVVHYTDGNRRSRGSRALFVEAPVKVLGTKFERQILARRARRLGEPVMTRVLVVEDDLSVGAAILMMLDREGCHAVHATDAHIGMRAFESSIFDLVIVDMFLPGIDGLKTIAGFRQRAPTVPILAMSGFRFRDAMNPGPDFLGMAAEAGATGCLRKPFAPQQLMAAVNASLDPVHPVFAW